MSGFMLVIGGVVRQVQPNLAEDFVPAPDGVICGQLWDGETLSDPPPGPDVTRPARTDLWLGNIYIEEDYVAGVDTDSGIAMAFFIDLDQIAVLFSDVADNLSYGWAVSTTSGIANITARDVAGLIITVAGAVEPYVLSVQIYRLVTS